MISKRKNDLLSVKGGVDQEKLAVRKQIFALEQECEILKKAAIWVLFFVSGKTSG
jgi:hypothetical protein